MLLSMTREIACAIAQDAAAAQMRHAGRKRWNDADHTDLGTFGGRKMATLIFATRKAAREAAEAMRGWADIRVERYTPYFPAGRKGWCITAASPSATPNAVRKTLCEDGQVR